MFWDCFWYLVLTGVLSFFVGRLLVNVRFQMDKYPFRSYSFERGGKIYEVFKIRQWQAKVLDMSKIFPKLMPPKDLSGDYKARLPQMIQETCIAELIHCVSCLTGLYCLRLWPGMGGVIIVLIHILLFNLPYILIQRYNRPRLLRLARRLKVTETEGKKLYASFDFKL